MFIEKCNSVIVFLLSSHSLPLEELPGYACYPPRSGTVTAASQSEYELDHPTNEPVTTEPVTTEPVTTEQ